MPSYRKSSFCTLDFTLLIILRRLAICSSRGDVHNHWPKDQEGEKAQCLSDLRITDPRHDKLRIESTKGGLLEDSYGWIFEHGDFQQWHDNKDRPLLWIKGDPGKGKTMLLCGIINKLRNQRSPKTLITYFFCQAGDSRINSATAVLRGLIYLAIDEQPQLISHIQSKYKHGKKTMFEDINAWTVLSEILSDILNDTSLEQSFVIIDALDECATDLRNLLDFINTKSTLFPQVKWVVSSRNWPEIEESLNSSASQQTRLCLELNDKSITMAVDIYIKHQVERLKFRRKFSEEIQRTLLHELSTKSNNTFLWVSLVCQNLEKTTSLDILEKLDEFPSGLNSVYRRMIKQINDIDGIDAKHCFQTLGIILLVYRPITLVELGCLFKRNDGNPATAEFISNTIALCGSFLTIREGKVYIIHQSAKDYLIAAAFTDSQLSYANIHNIIFEQSIKAMSVILQRNMYNLDPLGIPISQIERPDPDPLEPIRYSCTHWANHLCDMYLSNDNLHYEKHNKQHQIARSFLLKHFLYWLEALGLIECTEDGVISIIRLESLLKVRNVSTQLTYRFLELVQDARRFIQQNRSITAYNPLQVYASALIFSPSSSIMRKLFETEEPKWLKVKPNVDYNWTPCLQTISGHDNVVGSVAFSAKGYLASASRNGKIKFWNATTGRERYTINNGHHTHCIAFSVDGRYLAAGFGTLSTNIWDVTTGKKQQTFRSESQTTRNYHGWVVSLAFSIDGRYLALGAAGGSIRIWDIVLSKEQILEGHTARIHSIAFSTRHHLASGSDDATVKIWDVTGKEHQTLEGHKYSVRSVAFSADGQYLASGSADVTIKIWNMTTGKEHQTLQGRSGFCSIAFSPNRYYLASGQSDHSVTIWQVTVGKERHIFDDYEINSVALSADGNYLASGSSDGVIRIWDTTTGEERRRLKGHSYSVTSVAFSVEGRYLASVYWDCTIEIWDAMTGKRQRSIRDASPGRYCSIFFSQDGCYLAFSMFNRDLAIWDVKMGKLHQTIETRGSDYSLLTFSADGRYLASAVDGTNLRAHGFNNMAIRIWEIEPGKERYILKGHSKWVTSIAFSPDNQYLASGSIDGAINVWDIITGAVLQITKKQTLILTSRVIPPATSSAKDECENRLIANSTKNGNDVGYGLSLDACWITWNGHAILWLPPEYRSLQTIVRPLSASTSSQSPMKDVLIALGSRSGRVVIMRMPGSGPYSML
ncbi:hypothetical protein TRIATDRAFT_292965 [Trichoderma atroviride IMI 206040]|uniref:NACHT domain-containing protein n=1 Tax=Hypocrea atroviridis (strain ATCC 20476 / IMI 206040) TaxID=452589 RepID=G9NWX9_HYPAI|nr:uncharacterized protein TRIATDRAFT_292965 [Trichoderma atroviride IMI 206040]EHK45465.1 hypothetical protein TRIATDRAFT_292965 [Trichoderma atroviride IMI 206040]